MKPSSEMPEPQVLDYNKYYKVTPLFINDLKIVMANVPFVEARKLFDKIKEYKGILPAAILNELIRDISGFPFKYVSGIMAVLDNKDNFSKYFELLQPKEEKKETVEENKAK